MARHKKVQENIPERQKPQEVTRIVNPFIPPNFEIEKFVLPKKYKLNDLRRIAATITLSDLGVRIPRNCAYKDRFIAGFRHGLATNSKPKPEHLKDSFSWGFVWSKFFYGKFNPRHPLAGRGSFRGKG